MSILKKIGAGLAAVGVTLGLSALIGAAGGGIIHAAFGEAFLVNFYVITGLAGLGLAKRAFSPVLEKPERVGFAVGGLLAATLALGGGLRSELGKKGITTQFKTANETTITPVAKAAAQAQFKIS